MICCTIHTIIIYYIYTIYSLYKLQFSGPLLLKGFSFAIANSAAVCQHLKGHVHSENLKRKGNRALSQ